ncbi:two-component system, NarL family, sensor histidine kinase EvgS [Pseudomonas sp. NFR02]|uniref:transporter substrate-binding domain-containing protein n=1 Tax=Pseudomonas sp. NFR02 TaxID=1566229 RepID=UPI000919F967|nr:transporter substrate-binding domain-containing protein [Pseudomonas sp. NFR02]SFY22221.1 two-component system, NarL family, sensor histidine kinase EvgS [Pseudomonas sp. NFR02]
MAIYFLRILCFILTLLPDADVLAAPTALQLIVRTSVTPVVAELSPATQDWLDDHRLIRVAVWGADPYPPFDLQYQADGFEGISADYLGVLSQSLHIPLAIYRFASQEEAEQALLQGQVDMLALYTVDAHTRPDILNSVPYVLNHSVILKRPNESLDTSGDLAGRRLGVAAGSQIIARVKLQYPNSQIVQYNTPQNAVAALVYGQVDVLWSDLASADYLIRRAYLNKAIVGSLSRNPSFNASFAVSTDNLALLDGINEVLVALPLAQRMRIATRWRLGPRYVEKANPLALNNAERIWLNANKHVRVVVNGTYAPITFFDNKQRLHGLTSDVLNHIQKRSGLVFTVVPADSVVQAVDMLNNHQADMIGALTVSESRMEKLIFSRPYLATPFVISSKVDDAPLLSLSDLNGKTLAIAEGNSLIPWLNEKFPGIKVVTTDDAANGLELLSSGHVDGAVNTQISTEYFIDKFFKDRIRINSNIGPRTAHIAMATRKDEPLLLSIINKAMLDIPPEELSSMVERWRTRSNPALASSWSNYRNFVYSSIGIAIVIILLFIAWNIYLRKQINQRRMAELALSDQLEFARTLVNGSPVPQYVRDKNGCLMQCNDAYLDFLKTDREKVIGKTLSESPIMTSEIKESYHSLYQQTLIDGNPIFANLELFIQGQPYRVYHWTLPFRNAAGERIGIIGGWLDITERERLLLDVIDAREMADAANRSKSTFLASMSHEIRTPMNAIIGLLELLQQLDDDKEQAKVYLHAAYESAKSLLALVGDILDLSKIESGAMTSSLRATNIVELVESVFTLFEQSARRKGLETTLIIEVQNPHVLIDSLMLKQITSNLLSNAIKFTEFGNIELALFEELDVSDSEFRSYTIEVTDTGPGMNAAQQKAIFEPFIQVGDQSMTDRGTGLGLSISRRLAELMSSTIQVESELGIGSTFGLQLKAQLCDASEFYAPTMQNEQERKALHILIADDHSANRLLLAKQLEFSGHIVDTAENGEMAFTLWHNSKTPYDLVITDCNMPKIDGLAFTRMLRKVEGELGDSRIPILGLTANAQPEMVLACKQAGMTDCLFKPITLEEINHHVVRVVEDAKAGSNIPPANVALSSNADSQEKYFVQEDAFLEEIITTNRVDAEELRHYFKEQNLPRLVSLAHRIKGAAEYVHAREVVEACVTLEASAKTKDTAALKVEVSNIIDALQILELHLYTTLNARKKISNLDNKEKS